MKLIREFLKYEASGGIVIFFAAIIALTIKNSSFAYLYDYFLDVKAIIQIGEYKIAKPILFWINDGLMVIFFLLVGLEIKREIIQGHLSSLDQISLPIIAALGGVITPAIIYSAVNWGDDVAMRGWAIPSATDIAFAIGVISLLGTRVPNSLKLCLLALAIIDDLAAIIIIAIFYTAKLSIISICFAGIAILILFLMNRNNVTKLSFYLLVGMILWLCVLKSGVHATLAGAILAFFIPLKIVDKNGLSPAQYLEHGLNPWIAYLVLPLFAFANAGVSITDLSLADLTNTIPLGIALGLFLGKQIGVMLFTYIGVRLKLCRLPRGVNWLQYYGMAVLTGVGFTMSLFIGTLAFPSIGCQNLVRLGVFVGSVLSAIIGYLILLVVDKKVKNIRQ